MLSTNYIYAQQRTRHKVNSQLMADRNPEKPKSPTEQLSDTDTSDEEQINPVLQTSEEERHYRTIPGSALATQIVLSDSRTQANSTVELGPSHKVRIKKLPKEKAKDKSTQTEKQKKQTHITTDIHFCKYDNTDNFHVKLYITHKLDKNSKIKAKDWHKAAQLV